MGSERLPTHESIRMRTRVWKRLLQWGVPAKTIAGTFGCSHHLIYWYCRNVSSKLKSERRIMRARVWSRLLLPPFRMSQRQIGNLWGVTNVLVCTEVNSLRYFTPARSARIHAPPTHLSLPAPHRV